MFKGWIKLANIEEKLSVFLLPRPSEAETKTVRAATGSDQQPSWRIPAYLRQRLSGDRVSRYR